MARSIQQLPNNTTTAQTQAVYTATGFTAGDAVYYQNGDYVSPTVTPSAFANPTGSLTFTPTQTGPICSSGGVDANVGGVSPVLTGPSSGYAFKGGTRGISTAVLSDGNVVNVWMQQATMSNPGRPYFQITTPDGVQVVAPTLISSTFYTTSVPTVCVTALTGGGFVVAWQVTNGGTALKPCFAIYTNSGAVTTAVTQETTVTVLANTTAVNVTALTNGGFVMVVKATTSNNIYYRGFSSTGVAAYAWTLAFATANSTSPLGVASRANNGGEFIIADWSTTTNINYRVINYGGTSNASGGFGPVGVTTSLYNTAATTLTNGNFVIGYSGRNPSANQSAGAFSIMDTSYNVGTEVAISQNNQDVYTSGSIGTKSVQVLGLSTGGFVFAYLDGTMTINYAFFNSAGVVQSRSNAEGAIPYSIPNTFIHTYWQMSLIETSGFVRAYWSPAANNTSSLAVSNIFTTKISMSTYLVTYANSFTANVTPASTSAASIINVASSTLTNAKYNLVSNLTSTFAERAPSVLTATATITDGGCDGVYSATLTSGQLAVAYQVGGIDRVRVKIFSVDLVLQQTIEVAQAFDSGFLCRIIALSGGGFVVAYGSGGNAITFVVYNSSFAEVYRFASAGLSATTQTQNYAMAALTENNFAYVVANSGSGDTAVFIYSGTSNSLLFSNALTTGAGFGPWASSTAFIQIAGNNFGGFLVTAKGVSTNTSFAACYLQSGASTWTYGGASTLTMTTGTLYQQQGIAYNGAGMYLLYTTPTTSTGTHNINAIADGFVTGGSSVTATLLNITNNSTSFENAIGITGNGAFVAVTLGSAFNRIYGMPAVGSLANAGDDTTGTAFVTYPEEGRVVVTTSNADNSNNYVTVSPTIGNRAFIVRNNTSAQPVISSICAYPSFVTTFVPNTQVSSTAAVSINPQLNNTSTTISGTILAGFAATTASANSTGQLVTNGMAQLNSSYPATSAQSFDTTGLTIAGVKGTVKNRVINMQGNT